MKPTIYTWRLVALFWTFVFLGMQDTFLFCMERQSLCTYLKMPELERVPRDVQNRMVPAWWYRDQLFSIHTTRKTDDDENNNDIEDPGIEAIDMHPDGNQIAVATGSDVQLWDKDAAGTYQLTDVLKWHVSSNDVAYNPVTKALVSAGREYVFLREADEKLKLVALNSRGARKVAWSKDGLLLAIAYKNWVHVLRIDCPGALLDVPGQEFKNHLLYGSKDVIPEIINAPFSDSGSLCFSPDSCMLAILGDDFSIYDLETKTLHMTPMKDISSLEHIGRVAFHPRKNICATSSFEYDELKPLPVQIQIWDLHALNGLKSPAKQWVVDWPESDLPAIAFHPEKDLLVVGYSNVGIELADLEGNRLWRVRHYDPGQETIRGIVFDPSGTVMATAGLDTVVTWCEYKRPQLKQALLRRVLKNYIIDCLLQQEKPIITFRDEAKLVPWMVQTFPLQQKELEEVWQTIPQVMRQKIMNTFLYRVQQVRVLLESKKIKVM